MELARLGDLVKIKTWKLDANAKVEWWKYPFFTCAREISWIDKPTYDCECVLVAGNGDLNVKYYHGKFDAYQRTYIIECNSTSELSMKYLYYFMQSYLEKLRSQTIGWVIQYIKMNNLTDILIPLPSLAKQKIIVTKLDKLIDLIDLKKEAIWKTEELTTSVFSKIFLTGNLPEKSLSELVERIQIWPFGTQLHFSDYIENWIPLINPTNIKNGIIIPDFSNTITFEKAQSLSEYFLKEGDVIMWRRWEMWRCALVKIVEQGWFCWTGSLYLRPGKRISWLYLSNLLQTDKYKKILENESRGATMPNLNKGIISKLPIPIPPIEDTEKYYKITNYYAEVIENQNQSLQKLQELYNTTTQELFSF